MSIAAAVSETQMKNRITALVVVAAGAFALTSCGSDRVDAAKPAAGRPAGSPRTVRIERVAEIPMDNVIEVSGTLAAYETATLGLKVPGRISRITVDLGSRVQRGQLVAQVEPGDYQLRLQQADAAVGQARARLGLPLEGTEDRVDPEKTSTVRQAGAVLEEARLSLERSRYLLGRGLISKSQMEQIEADFKVAESRHADAIEEVRNREALLIQRRTELALARQQLADTSVYAPFDGTVEEKQASVGEFLAAGTPVVKVVKTNPLRLRADVPERESRLVKIGQQVRVTAEGDSKVYTGQIVRLSPSIRQDNRTLLVEADVRNDGSLRAGTFAQISIVAESGRRVPAIRSGSILVFAGLEKVIVPEGGKAVEKQVTTGRRSEGWVEVTDGIAVGDEYVADPGNLQTGQPIAAAR